MVTSAGWYPDPDGSGAQRYFDGNGWTEHRAPAPGPPPTVGYPPPWPPPAPTYPGYAYPGSTYPGYGYQAGPGAWGAPPWKGAQLGRPAAGPGALANPGRRLGARALDVLVMLPVLAVLVTVAVVIVAPHAGPIFPTQQYQNSDGREPTPGFVWIYLAVLGAIVVFGIAMVTYQSVATARYGRTLGKRWLHIRPLRVDGSRVGWGRALGREAIYWLSTVLGWLGFLDPLWCLWDGNHQCIHDKVADTIVVND